MQMSDTIIRVLDHLFNQFGIAIDWSQQNILPYVQELCTKMVSYKFWASVASLILFPLFAAAVTFLFCKSIKKFEDASYDTEDVYMIVSIILGISAAVLIIVSLIEIPINIGTIIACKTFPEKIIIDTISALK